MRQRNQILTASNIKYLLAISSLSCDHGGIRCVNVANALGITKPSVHTMINTLCAMNLATKAKYGTVQLTPEGESLAALYRQYYTIVRSHLEDTLFLSAEQAKSIAFLLLAEIPETELRTMCQSIVGLTARLKLSSLLDAQQTPTQSAI